MAIVTHKHEIISLDDLKAKMDRKEKFHLWNVLTKEYFKPEESIPGSKWFPVDTINEATAAAKAGKDDYIVVYCGGPECTASKEAAEKLNQLGYTRAFAYEGGLQEWSENHLPFAKAQ